jgi:hypothetical protein
MIPKETEKKNQINIISKKTDLDIILDLIKRKNHLNIIPKVLFVEDKNELQRILNHYAEFGCVEKVETVLGLRVIFNENQIIKLPTKKL